MSAVEPLGDAPTIDQARAIAAAGLKVLPIAPGRKNPPMKAWQHAASVEDKAINAWWNGLYRNHGIGIAMGPQPDGRNLFAVDIDTHDEDANGYDTIADLEAIHGALPDTVTSNTGSGGQHLIFAAPKGAPVRNQQNAGQRIGPGVDVRGDGGQIVVAPTVHPDTNRRYQWAAGLAPWDIEVADAPKWLLDLVVDRPAPPAPTPPPRQHDLYSSPTSAADIIRDRWIWDDELTATGWQLATVDGADSYWTRPGKDVRKGHSAVLHGVDGPFVVFTTDIPAELRALGHSTRDGSGFAFSPLEWNAAYHHGGSMSAASKAALGTVSAPSTPATATQAPEVPVEPEPDYDDTLRGLLVDWGEFWNTDHKEAEWIAEPLIAARRSTALFAPGGTGKSLLSLYISACVAVGRPLLGRRTTPMSVLYLDYEMTADDLAERLEQMGFGEEVDLSNLHYALLPSLPPLDDPEGGKAVVRLAEMVGAELVVIDTFGRAVEGDENDADTVRSFYRWTGLHLKHAGRAFLRVDHAGKDVAKGQRGTSAKNDDVDVVWQMTAKDDGVFTMTAKKRRMGWVPLTVDIVMREGERMVFELLHGASYPAGTKEMADRLEALGIPAEMSGRKASKLLRDAGQTATDALVRAAQRHRTEELSPVDSGEKSAAESARRRQVQYKSAAPVAAVDENSHLPAVPHPSPRFAAPPAATPPTSGERSEPRCGSAPSADADDLEIPDTDESEPTAMTIDPAEWEGLI